MKPQRRQARKLYKKEKVGLESCYAYMQNKSDFYSMLQFWSIYQYLVIDKTSEQKISKHLEKLTPNQCINESDKENYNVHEDHFSPIKHSKLMNLIQIYR